MILTHIKAVTKDEQSITMRLGDVFTLGSKFLPSNQGCDVASFVVLGLLTTALVKEHLPGKSNRIYFTMVGLDKIRYSISKVTKSGITILNRGKEIELNEDYIIKSIKRLPSKSGGKVDGIEMYTRILWTTADTVKKMDMHKLSIRMRNMSEWPRSALRTWATRHLQIPSMAVPPIEMMDDRAHMINSMTKLSTVIHHKSEKVCIDHTMIRHTRYNMIHGISRVNLHGVEVSRSIDYAAIIRPGKDLPRGCIAPYSIIYIDGTPMWITLRDELGHAHISWRFIDGPEIITAVYNYTTDTEQWLLNEIPPHKLERNDDNTAGGYAGSMTGRIKHGFSGIKVDDPVEYDLNGVRIGDRIKYNNGDVIKINKQPGHNAVELEDRVQYNFDNMPGKVEAGRIVEEARDLVEAAVDPGIKYNFGDIRTDINGQWVKQHLNGDYNREHLGQWEIEEDEPEES